MQTTRIKAESVGTEYILLHPTSSTSDPFRALSWSKWDSDIWKINPKHIMSKQLLFEFKSSNLQSKLSWNKMQLTDFGFASQ